MKKKLCISTMLIVFPLYCMAQINAIGLTAGYTSGGYGLFTQYNQYLGEESKSKLQFGLSLSNAPFKINNTTVPYFNVAAHGGYGFVILSERRNTDYFGSITGGGLIGLDVLNRGKEQLDDGSFVSGNIKTVYGGYISADFDYFVTSNLALSIVINQSYIANSDVREFNFYVGVGTKFYTF